jgi:hypothetical protein
MGIVKPSEEIGTAEFSKGPILVTFTITETDARGVESISFK